MTPAVAGALAAGVALAGWRAGWLTGSGAAAATLVGSGVLWGAGLQGLVLLGTFFVSGSVLSSRPGSRSPRGAVQVGANGWAAAVGGLLIPHVPAIGWVVLAGGLAAAQADTWATEIGRRSRHPPVMLTTGRPVEAGTSGGVTWLGTLGGILGAVTIAGIAAVLGIPIPTAGWLVGAGVGGMFADSLLGATLQARGRCAECGATVELPRHCGQPTTPTRGLRWMTNDTVNAIGAGVGAAIALLPVLG